MKDVRVFLACFFGALVGGIIAREVGSGLWWLGSIAGFLVGYLSYEFKQVIYGIQKAWNAVVRIDFKKKLLETLFEIVSVVAGIIVLIIAMFLFLFWIRGILYSWQAFSNFITKSSLTGFSVEESIGLGIAFLVSLLASLSATSNITNNSDDTVKQYIIAGINPFILFGFVMPRWIFLVIKKSPIWIPLLGKFFVELFRYIHSDVRLLCGVDAAIGAGVGYFAGDILIGALFGGAFGLLNYKIVRTYILKISPQEN